MTIVRHSLQPVTLTVDPGGQAVCTVTIKNTGSIVEAFNISVVGAASSWAMVDPPAISLLPDAERTVTVTFRPTRGPVPNAGTIPFGVKVTPTKQSDETAVEEGDITVTPFVEFVPGLRPRASRGVRVGHHVLRLTNRGNAPAEVALSASDPDDLLRLRVRPDKAQVRPGATIAARIDVRPRQVKFVGQFQPLPFQARIQPTNAPQVPVDGSFIQRPVLPKWLPRAAVVVAIAAVGTFLYANKAAQVKNVAKPASAIVTTTTVPKPGGPAGQTATSAAGGAGGPATPTTAGGTATTKGTATVPGGVAAAGVAASGTLESGVGKDDLTCLQYDPNTIHSAPAPPPASTTTSTTIAGATSTAPPGPIILVTTSNPNIKFQFTSQDDANAAIFVLSKYQQVCFIGAGNGLVSREMMVLEPLQSPLTNLPANLSGRENCTQYNSSTLAARPIDGTHQSPWLDDLSTDQTSPLDVQDLDNTSDAARALKVAQAHQKRCWIGGGTTWTSLDHPPSQATPNADPNALWVLEYWR